MELRGDLMRKQIPSRNSLDHDASMSLSGVDENLAQFRHPLT